MQEVRQQVRAVYFQPFVFSEAQCRVFFCNAISFTNNGTGTAYLNDVYPILSGGSVNLECDQNEIDETVYKLSFAPGFINQVAVMIKINGGSSASVQNRLSSFVSPGSRRDQVKKYIQRRNRGDF